MKRILMAALVIFLIGCETVPAPQTAEQGWNHAKRVNKLYAYRSFVKDHPQSPYDVQAKHNLREAQAARKQLLVSNSHEGKQMQAAGKRVWIVTNDAGEEIVLYQGMTVDQTEQALGFPLILIPKGFENLKVNYACPVTGIQLLFASGGILSDVGLGARRFNEDDLQRIGVDPSYFPRSLSLQ